MEMKERQRWRPEEDALLRAYVKQYGPREWNLVSQRMNTPLSRDGKSCLERWKNYLKPGIKKGSLTEEEQRLVIRLQEKHGNKWKKIAAEVPGRTAKRLGKWWEVFKEKQQREQKNNGTVAQPIEEGKYDRILETFAEKLVKEQRPTLYLMAASNGGAYLRSNKASPAPSMLPPWLSNSNATSHVRALSPSVTLSLSPTVAPARGSQSIPWLQQPDRGASENGFALNNMPPPHRSVTCGESYVISELVECSRELEEVHHAWAAHKKEATWRLKRVELQLESEKASRKREKMDDIEAKMKALREEQKATIDMIEAEYREQIAGLRRDAEIKEQKLADQWSAKHTRLAQFLEQMGGGRPRLNEPNGSSR